MPLTLFYGVSASGCPLTGPYGGIDAYNWGMTDAAAKRLKAPAKGQVDYFDPDFPGLVLRVSCGGRKVWTYNFRFHGQKRRMTLDLYPVMGVAPGA